MKSVKRNIKTEESVDQIWLKKKRVREWLQFSTKRNKNTQGTPLRFASITLKNKNKEKDTASTKGQNDTSIHKQNSTKVKTQIFETVDILKQLWRDKDSLEQQNSSTITPFSLTSQDHYEQQLSFKGVSNKLKLFQLITRIQKETSHLLTSICKIKENKSQIAQNMHQGERKKQQEFFRHVEQISKQVKAFQTEYLRCRSIVTTSTGISENSLSFYKSKFQSLISGLKEKIKCLDKLTKTSGKQPRTKMQNIKVQKCFTINAL